MSFHPLTCSNICESLRKLQKYKSPTTNKVMFDHSRSDLAKTASIKNMEICTQQQHIKDKDCFSHKNHGFLWVSKTRNKQRESKATAGSQYFSTLHKKWQFLSHKSCMVQWPYYPHLRLQSHLFWTSRACMNMAQICTLLLSCYTHVFSLDLKVNPCFLSWLKGIPMFSLLI